MVITEWPDAIGAARARVCVLLRVAYSMLTAERRLVDGKTAAQQGQLAARSPRSPLIFQVRAFDASCLAMRDEGKEVEVVRSPFSLCLMINLMHLATLPSSYHKSFSKNRESDISVIKSSITHTLAPHHSHDSMQMIRII